MIPRAKLPQGVVRRCARISLAVAILLACSTAVTQPQAAAQTITFDNADNGSNSFTRTVDGVTASFSNPVGEPFSIGESLLFLGNAGPSAFDISFDTDVTLEQYNRAFGTGTFSVVGPGVNSTGNSGTGNQSFVSGPLNLTANTAYTFAGSGFNPLLNINFTFVPAASDPGAGTLTSSLTQTTIQTSFNTIDDTVTQILGIGGVGDDGGALVVTELPTPAADVLPASYHQGSLLASANSGPLYTVRAQNADCGCVHGWMRGYGLFGNVNGQAGVADLDYAAGGTQFGVYRHVCEGTLVGVFGGYTYQNVDTSAQQSATVNGGQLGAFLRRRDDCGNYYLLLASGGYDSYDSSRVTATGTARGSFDGAQTALLLQRGWSIPRGCYVVRPTVSLHHVFVQQDGFTETGAGANNSTVSSIDQHALRSLIGARISTQRCTPWGLASPTLRAHWMHEYLDTSTTAGLSIGGGAATTARGIDLGRDFVVLGLGTALQRSECLTLYARYDTQMNERTDFHLASAGFNWLW